MSKKETTVVTFFIYLFSPRLENLKKERDKIGENAIAKSIITARKYYAKKFHFSLPDEITTTWNLEKDNLIPPKEIFNRREYFPFFDTPLENPQSWKKLNRKCDNINSALAHYLTRNISHRGARST